MRIKIKEDNIFLDNVFSIIFSDSGFLLNINQYQFDKNTGLGIFSESKSREKILSDRNSIIYIDSMSGSNLNFTKMKYQTVSLAEQKYENFIMYINIFFEDGIIENISIRFKNHKNEPYKEILEQVIKENNKRTLQFVWGYICFESEDVITSIEDSLLIIRIYRNNNLISKIKKMLNVK